MSEEDAEKIWDLIQVTFALNDVEEVAPELDEVATIKAKKDLMKELGL